MEGRGGVCVDDEGDSGTTKKGLLGEADRMGDVDN